MTKSWCFRCRDRTTGKLRELGLGSYADVSLERTREKAGEQTGFPREIVEYALAHQLKDKAEAAHARSTLLRKRRGMMEAWASLAGAWD